MNNIEGFVTNLADFADRLIAELNVNGTGQDVTVLVGENGGGKTRFLKHLHSRLLANGAKALLIPANRQLQTYGSPGSQPTGRPSLSDLTNANPAPESPTLQSLLMHTVLALSAVDKQVYNEFVAQTAAWIDGEKQAPEPTRPSKQLPDFLASLSEIVGYRIVLENHQDRPASRPFPEQLLIVSGDERRSLDALSDGERQILLFAIFLLQQPSESIFLLVDEPELHLNDARCIMMWEAIERSLPNAKFLYATHSLNFATRSAVNRLFSVERGEHFVELSLAESIPDTTLRRIVGARIQLLRTEAFPIFCEDDAQRLLVSDLFKGENVVPVVVGNWETVRSAVASDGALKELLSGRMRKCGLIDRDFHSPQALTGLENIGVFALPYNESESLLLHPALAEEFISTVAPSGFNANVYKLALQKAAQLTLSESVQLLSKKVAQDNPALISYDIISGVVENVRLSSQESSLVIFKAFAQELLLAQQSGDADRILECFKGKVLYRHMRSTLKEQQIELPSRASQQYNTIRNYRLFPNSLLSIVKMQSLKDRMMAYLQG